MDLPELTLAIINSRENYIYSLRRAIHLLSVLFFNFSLLKVTTGIVRFTQVLYMGLTNSMVILKSGRIEES